MVKEMVVKKPEVDAVKKTLEDIKKDGSCLKDDQVVKKEDEPEKECPKSCKADCYPFTDKDGCMNRFIVPVNTIDTIEKLDNMNCGRSIFEANKICNDPIIKEPCPGEPNEIRKRILREEFKEKREQLAPAKNIDKIMKNTLEKCESLEKCPHPSTKVRLTVD